MRIDILTLFPEMFVGPLSESMLGRARENGVLDIRTYNIRDYADNKHNKTDDYPFGGGAGMVMMTQPIFDCVEQVLSGERAHRILLTPRGKTLTSARARELAEKPRLLLLCGHYEGVDERVMRYIDEEISIGDYVLTGGELPAMVLIDCISRLQEGVLGDDSSPDEESFSDDALLEYPHYTRPREFEGMAVPEVLLSGHHAEIENWRRQQRLLATAQRRPDLLEKARLTGAERAWLKEQGF